METNKIYCGNCVDVMGSFPGDSVDMVVTSPPYDNLRDYNGYSFDVRPIIGELYRILKSGGVVVWVVGDSVINGGETGTSFRHALSFMEYGFTLYDTMIYEKAGSIPAKNRYLQVFEYMFIFSKGKPNTINLIKDRKNIWGGKSTFGHPSFRNKDGTITKTEKRIIQEYGYRTNIWRYANGYGFGQKDKVAYQHPATFPELLARDHILSWSNEGDIVLDPMCGSGTTCKMAKILNRNFIGIDISPEYCNIAKERLNVQVSSL